MLQADGDYDLEKGNNRGDTEGIYFGGGATTLNSTTTPSTRSYQGGVVHSTGVIIAGVSASGPIMTFGYGFDGDVYVDWSNASKVPDGSIVNPFPTVLEGYQAAVPGNTIRIRGGDYLESPLSITKHVRIRNYQGAARVGE